MRPAERRFSSGVEGPAPSRHGEGLAAEIAPVSAFNPSSAAVRIWSISVIADLNGNSLLRSESSMGIARCKVNLQMKKGAAKCRAPVRQLSASGDQKM